MSQPTRKTLRLDLVALTIIGLLTSTFWALSVCAAEELTPGPYMTERLKLKARIEKLKEDGVGIKPYQDALGSIEESVVAKEPDEQIQKSVERLNSALDHQMQSKAAISSNTYYHVHGSPSPTHSSPISSSGGAGGGGGSAAAQVMPQIPKGVTPDMIQKMIDSHPEMKQKFEDYKKTGHL
ncbi:MAG: hypothetical protein P4L53_15970 [Candidatus Obscuribacterales bacterium]|nr:hypothetical protein [Candidatus Obscuribacterales bacterium]